MMDQIIRKHEELLRHVKASDPYGLHEQVEKARAAQDPQGNIAAAERYLASSSVRAAMSAMAHAERYLASSGLEAAMASMQRHSAHADLLPRQQSLTELCQSLGIQPASKQYGPRFKRPLAEHTKTST